MGSIEAAFPALALQDKPNISTTAKLHSADRTTLSRRWRGKTKRRDRYIDSVLLLTKQQQKNLVLYINKFTERGMRRRSAQTSERHAKCCMAKDQESLSLLILTRRNECRCPGHRSDLLSVRTPAFGDQFTLPSVQRPFHLPPRRQRRLEKSRIYRYSGRLFVTVREDT